MNRPRLVLGALVCGFLLVTALASAQTCPCFGQTGTNYRSIGTNGGILHSGGAGEATIGLGGTQVSLTTANLPADVIGVGDQLTIDPGGGNQEIFYIRVVHGPGLVTIHGTASAAHAGESYEIRRAYTTLQDWENARDGDLVFENRAEVGVAYDDGAAFTGVVAIDALSSSPTNYMHLAVARGHEHGGIAGGGVVLDGLGGTNGINILENYTRVEGFELQDHTVERAIFLGSLAGGVVLDRLLIHDAAYAIRASGASTFTLRNSIIYDSTESVHDEGTTATIENCTIYNIALGAGGLNEGIGFFTVANTISMDNAGPDFNAITTQTDNMSSDGTAVGFPGRSSANQFVNVAGRDLHLKSGSEAIDNGATRSICCDVDGEPRVGLFDIGADERDNSIYRSIGTAGNYTAGTIVATDGWRVVYGVGSAWETANRGRGDRIDINGTDYTILSVDSETQLTLTAPVSGGDYSGGYTISRQFAAPQDWEDCISGSGGCTYFPVVGGNLVTDDRSEVGIAYKDGPLTGPTIDGATTDASHTITLTADGDNRHYGVPGNGVVMTGAGGVAGIRVRSEFVTVEWIEVTGGTDEGVEFEVIDPANRAVVRNMLVHDILLEGILLDDADIKAEIYNNIVYNTDAGLSSLALTTGSIDLYNNTFFNNTNEGITASGSNPTFTLRNNISHSNGGADFDVSGHHADSSNNLSSDASGPAHSPNQGAPNGIQEPVLANLNFVDTVGPDLDLHITAGSTAEDAGADLSAFFTDDIDGAGRIVAWDIGADDLAATTAVELIAFTAVREGDAVVVRWETASELDNLGFHVYRASSAGGPFERVTATPIPGLGSSPVGATYEYVDAGADIGQTLYYELEDIETTGARERHGPITVTLASDAAQLETSETSEASEASGTTITYGDPEAGGVRVLRRTSSSVVLELSTRGFVAEPDDDGSVRISVPGFAETDGLPVYRTWVGALEDRDVMLERAWARDVRVFSSFDPGTSVAEVVASGDGSVRLRRRRGGRPGASPTLAKLVEVAVQGDDKKALVELSPFRWDGNELSVATKLYVRLSFTRTKQRARSRPLDRVWRLTTENAGLHAVALPTRTGAEVRLTRGGRDVPCHVEGGSLFFLGAGDGAVYELEAGQPGTEMVVVASNAGGAFSEALWHTVRREESLLYQAGLVTRNDPWLWDALLAPATGEYDFDVSGLLPGPGYVRVWLQGTSDFETDEDHHVRVTVNGSFVTERRWDGKTEVRLDGELSPGVLREGANVLAIENVGDTSAAYSLVMLDGFEVDHRRRHREGQTHGTWHEDSVVDARWVVDTTEAEPRWVRGRGVEAGRSYVVVDRAHEPIVSRVDRSSLLRTKRADWIVIGPRAFIEAAQPLVAHRRGQGLAVQAVATEDIYDAFGGEARAEAIQQFLRFAYQEWRKPAFRYVLLLGDGSYDARDYLKTGKVNHVPPVMVRTSYLWTASDPAYAAVNGDDLLPDVAIGRLPAATLADVRVMVRKILEYESADFSHAPSAVLVADDPDAAGDFEDHANELAQGVLAPFTTERVFLSRLGAAGARSEVRAALDGGVSLMSYIGHGAIHLWASENVFNTGDIDALTPSAEQPILLTMNCLNGFFHFPYFDSLAEGMVKADGKGAIAAFSPSGLSLDAPAHRYHTILLEELVGGEHARLGDAVLRAQSRFADSGALPELLAIYHLFGDPALPLATQR